VRSDTYNFPHGAFYVSKKRAPADEQAPREPLCWKSAETETPGVPHAFRITRLEDPAWKEL